MRQTKMINYKNTALEHLMSKQLVWGLVCSKSVERVGFKTWFYEYQQPLPLVLMHSQLYMTTSMGKEPI